MQKNSCVATWVISRMLVVMGIAMVAACARSGGNDVEYAPVATPTVDYVESLDVYTAPHKDSFLNQLAMNYRSYAIYNARTSGYPDMGELFANKAVAAFSGDTPFPETLQNWPVENEQEAFELYTAYNELMEELKNDASYQNPELAAETQAKFDCWLSASATGQIATANQCRDRFQKAMTALRDCHGGKIVKTNFVAQENLETMVAEMQVETETRTAGKYYPDTRNMNAMRGAGNARDGVIVVNNVNVPEHLIKPVPVQPMVFNQNIYGGDKTANDNSVRNSNNSAALDCPHGAVNCPPAPTVAVSVTEKEPMISEELVTREEFINMMMAMRAELAAINSRLDQLQAAAGEKTMIKVQQIPLEPTQHVMEEVFEIRFDFNKAVIKPEYKELIQQLASATQENKNIKVSVVGHTDTSGSKNYNYALGGRRADAVQKMLIKYGIPASQIVAVSAGEEDLAVPTPDNTPNAANRRVRVVKEIHYTEEQGPVPMMIEVEGTDNAAASGQVVMDVVERYGDSCGEYGCIQ